MSKVGNRQVQYVRPPQGQTSHSQFRCIAGPIPVPGNGQILVRNEYLSVDPYQRRRMAPGTEYGQGLTPGDIMIGRTMARVLISLHPRFSRGDWVRGSFGWQEYAVGNAEDTEVIDLDGFSPSLYLGVLGRPGLTAWVGLREIAKASAGETVVVSAATGAVGSTVIALAHASNCRVVAIAGGVFKCNYALDALGCAACIDHQSPEFESLLAQAAPDGVDVDFENVGGPVFDAVLQRLNPGARIALCGMISQYETPNPYAMRNIITILNKNVLMQGFRISNYLQHRESATIEIKHLLRQGLMRAEESMIEGLENAPQALIDLFQGKHLGKPVIHIAH